MLQPRLLVAQSYFYLGAHQQSELFSDSRGDREAPAMHQGTWEVLQNHYLILRLCKAVVVLRIVMKKLRVEPPC